MRKLLTEKQIKLYLRLQERGSKRMRKKAETILGNDLYLRYGYKTHRYKIREK